MCKVCSSAWNNVKQILFGKYYVHIKNVVGFEVLTRDSRGKRT